jgi:predicted O-linked N-acetylglucosamine transferase (SPINDLY family)
MRERLQSARRAQDAGNLAEAVRLYGEVLRADPRNIDALLSLGLLHFRSAQFDEAERLCGEAARINPRSADALYIRGCALQRLNRGGDALDCFERAIAIRPRFVEALINRGALLMSGRRHADALESFDAALAINPAMPEAWNNRGNALSELSRHADAVASYEKVLAVRPDAIETWINRGTALIALRRFHEALESYDRAARLAPERADALAGRANALFEAKDYELAAAAYAAVLGRDPDYPYARGNLAFSRLYCCDWSSLQADRATIAQGVRNGARVVNPFQAIALIHSPADLKRCAILWNSEKYPAAPPLWRGERYDHSRIRVAYLSADFNGHAVATLLAGVCERHDRTRFETTAISYVSGDGGAMRRRLERAFDRMIDVAGMSDADVAALIRRSEIDIAVDLMGYTGECRPGILVHRPAPVAVSFLGFPGTIGGDHVDYIIADSTIAPKEHLQHYSEHVVHLPDTYLPTDSTRRISDRIPARADAGLPEEGFVFCSFNNSYKLSPVMLDIWMRLLGMVESSVLWLPQTNAAALRNLRMEAAKRGVQQERLVFASFVRDDADHLARLTLADLFLDTLPYNAHSTAVDALWAGVPVLTILGTSFAGRVAASLLKAAGLAELIAPSVEAYEGIALKLAREPQSLVALKGKLHRNRESCALFDTRRYTRNLEAAYAQMWQRQQDGLPPINLSAASLRS